MDWLIDEMEVPYDVAATQYPDHSANRQIGVVGRSPNFIDLMAERLNEMGGIILLETRATGLLTDDEGSVVGGANGKDSMTAMMNSWAIGSGRIGGEHAAENALADQKAD